MSFRQQWRNLFVRFLDYIRNDILYFKILKYLDKNFCQCWYFLQHFQMHYKDIDSETSLE